LKALRAGDTLLVWKLDRLGRDLCHLVNIIHDLTEPGIGLRVLTVQGAAIDTVTASGELVVGLWRPWPSKNGSCHLNGQAGRIRPSRTVPGTRHRPVEPSTGTSHLTGELRHGATRSSPATRSAADHEPIKPVPAG
jgi:hypothetical protein